MDRHEYERKHGRLREIEHAAKEVMESLGRGQYEPAVMDKVRQALHRLQLVHDRARSAIAELDAEHRGS